MLATPGRNQWISHVVLLFCACVLPASVLSQELQYRVVYRGVFSAGAEVAIADVELGTRFPGAGAYAEAHLRASSERYPLVEAIYPIRYRFRSWYRPDGSGVLAAEYLEYGSAADREHKLIYLDRPEAPFITRRLERTLPDLASLERGDYRSPPSGGVRRIFDRLGLLQLVRGLELAPGREIEASVSNGSHLLRYLVKVESEVEIKVAGRPWRAFKVRFDGLREDKQGREKHAHRPVFIWLSVDPRHIPLVAESRHSLGLFRVELAPPGDGVQVAYGSE